MAAFSKISYKYIPVVSFAPRQHSYKRSFKAEFPPFVPRQSNFQFRCFHSPSRTRHLSFRETVPVPMRLCFVVCFVTLAGVAVYLTVEVPEKQETGNVENEASQTLFRTASAIPDDVLAKHSTIPCKVVSVVDGDTLRCRHIPPGAGKDDGSWRKRFKDETLLLRLGGIDAPEMAKGGTPGQPLSKESKALLHELCQGKTVEATLLGRDQYNRALVTIDLQEAKPRRFLFVQLKPKIHHRDVGETLVVQGLADVYEGRGAQYGGNRDRYYAARQQARDEKRGLWSLDPAMLETPAEFKRQQRKLQLKNADGKRRHSTTCRPVVEHGGDAVDRHQ